MCQAGESTDGTLLDVNAAVQPNTFGAKHVATAGYPHAISTQSFLEAHAALPRALRMLRVDLGRAQGAVL